MSAAAKAKKKAADPHCKNDQEITIDRTGKKNGRGAYLCDNLECLVKARKNRGLNRAFRMEVDESVYEELERQLLNESK